jgi:hypothetical protein
MHIENVHEVCHYLNKWTSKQVKYPIIFLILRESKLHVGLSSDRICGLHEVNTTCINAFHLTLLSYKTSFVLWK